jgi:hypothetical protein
MVLIDLILEVDFLVGMILFNTPIVNLLVAVVRFHRWLVFLVDLNFLIGDIVLDNDFVGLIGSGIVHRLVFNPRIVNPLVAMVLFHRWLVYRVDVNLLVGVFFHGNILLHLNRALDLFGNDFGVSDFFIVRVWNLDEFLEDSFVLFIVGFVHHDGLAIRADDVPPWTTFAKLKSSGSERKGIVGRGPLKGIFRSVKDEILEVNSLFKSVHLVFEDWEVLVSFVEQGVVAGGLVFRREVRLDVWGRGRTERVYIRGWSIAST